MCPPILLITVFILLRAERSGFSIARDLELRSRDAKVLEILLGSARPLFAQDEVVCHSASLIAMAFDQHRLAPIGAKPSGIGIQQRHGVLANLKPVVIEKHIPQCAGARYCARLKQAVGWHAAGRSVE